MTDPRTSLTRYPQRGSSQRADLDALLDEELVATLATVVDGEPWTVPMLFARDGDRVVVHGSTGAGALRHVAAGAPVTLTVHAVDGIVLAHSAFDSSASYRSAVLRGTLEPLTGDDATRALDALTDKVVPGRVAEVRASTPKELAATAVLALAIEDGSWLYKARSGGAGAPDEDTDAWYGVVPLRTVADEPVTEPGCAAPVPASVRDLVARHQ